MSARVRPLKYLLGWLIAGTRGGVTRAQIIKGLKEKPQNANQLANLLKMDYRTIRHHLGILEKNRIITSAGARAEEIRAEINAMLEEWGVEVPEFLGPHAHRFRDGRHRGMQEFLTHSESVELEGTAVVLFKDMLVVDAAEGQVQIHLSRAWIVDGELTMRGDLFEGGYLSEGEDVTVQALRADVVDKEGLNIYFLLGYEIVDDTGVPASAVLPFNIETST